MNKLKKYFFTAALAGALQLSMVQVSFGLNLVQDGDFEDLSVTPTNQYGGGLSNTAGTGGEAGDLAVLTDWNNPNTYYNFLFTGGNPGDQTITGTGGNFELAGPSADGGSIANGLALPTNYTGNVIAADPVYEAGPITQTISTPLTVGQKYTVTFLFAGAEQYNYNTVTTENWTVALTATTGLTTTAQLLAVGGQTTPTVTTPANGFSGWQEETFIFTANATSETLYFLAGGGPDGDPPFALLADVNMAAVPEPITTSAWVLLFGMLIMFGKRAWHRNQKTPLATA